MENLARIPELQLKVRVGVVEVVVLFSRLVRDPPQARN
jgi:hypothetical protein